MGQTKEHPLAIVVTADTKGSSSSSEHGRRSFIHTRLAHIRNMCNWLLNVGVCCQHHVLNRLGALPIRWLLRRPLESWIPLVKTRATNDETSNVATVATCTTSRTTAGCCRVPSQYRRRLPAFSEAPGAAGIAHGHDHRRGLVVGHGFGYFFLCVQNIGDEESKQIAGMHIALGQGHVADTCPAQPPVPRHIYTGLCGLLQARTTGSRSTLQQWPQLQGPLLPSRRPRLRRCRLFCACSAASAQCEAALELKLDAAGDGERYPSVTSPSSTLCPAITGTF